MFSRILSIYFDEGQPLRGYLQKNKSGFNHVETAQYYGTSEVQLGMGFKSLKVLPRIIQTKIPPNKDTKIFENELIKTFERLQVEKIDKATLKLKEERAYAVLDEIRVSPNVWYLRKIRNKKIA